jgi:hypothetical protein
MSRSADLYVRRVQFNEGVLRGLCKDVGEEEARRPIAGRSSFWWVLGHVVEHRAVPLRLLGGDRSSPLPLGELFGRDTLPRTDVAHPTIAELVAEFGRLGGLLAARARELGDAAEDVEYETPARTRLPVGAFFLFHEDYHLGQLGLMRVHLGCAPLVPPRKRD